MDWLDNRPICIEDIIIANIFKSNKTIPGNMGAGHDERSLHRYNNLIPVGWTVLVMGDLACYGRNFMVMVWKYRTNLLFRHFNSQTENVKAALWPPTSACHYRS